ncbi:MAG: PVC-type heme-binding CxxCH protein [Verrucomicrobiota bacterium]
MQHHRRNSLRDTIMAAGLGALLHSQMWVNAEPPLPQIERLESSPVLRHLKKNPLRTEPASPAEQTVAQMYVPEGFRVELVIAEPQLHQPVAFAWDERGRLWVAEAYSYPQKQPAGKGLDKIVIFADTDGDGKFETRKIFADGLNLVSGIEVGYGGVWVGAAPELLFIPDRNRDDRPDGEPQVLLDGFGFQDTHECLNSFLWGPDGWLYGNQGVFNFARIGKPGAADTERIELRAGVWRYHPVRHEFEVFAFGGSNQWGLDFDERGQLFMTHCRSYWGRGGTTHVIQGGHFWNQANANYAPFIIANPPEEFPTFRNYLLASARHDHGAGGAGLRGTDAVYGGHSHVGTMIYLGDNWPDEFRGRLFTHNLGGHQINHDINRPLGSGFETVHAERDQFFCTDPKYVAVDLQYGPDGAVYMIDWYDQQHCHNPNFERWDRGNGRMYRMQLDATYQARAVDLSASTDLELVKWHEHKNEWFVRTARRLLHERAQSKPIGEEAVSALRETFSNAQYQPPARRLNALLTLHAVGKFSDDLAQQAAGDADEYVRGWAIQLAADDRQVSSELLRRFVLLARTDPSPVVRRFLASAIQRVPDAAAWELIEALAAHAEDSDDRNLPFLIWHGLAQRLPGNVERGLAASKKARLSLLKDWAHWYAATLGNKALDEAVAMLSEESGELLRRRLAGLDLALSAQANVPMPSNWKKVAPQLYASSDSRVQRAAERLAAAFGDDSMFPRLRQALADAKAASDLRRHAFAVLSRALDRASLPAFIGLLDEAPYRTAVIPLLARFDSAEAAQALLARFEKFSAGDRSAALDALTSRTSFAVALLDGLAAGKIKRDQLTAFHIRQLLALKNPEVDRRVASTWGKVFQSPAEKIAQINRLEKVFSEAPLWAFDSGAGRLHFQKLCGQCHRLGNDGARLGPELTGAGKHGIRYYLENVIDPNAVIGTDFQMTTVETKSGDVLSGILAGETESAVTIRTTTGESVIAKADVLQRETSEKSLMPEGLLESLNEREQIELLKFLTSN